MTTFKASKAWWVLVIAGFLVGSASFSIQGCTDLDEEIFSSVTPDNFFQTDEEVLAAVAPVYAQLRNMLDSYYNLTEHSSDEMLVPVRGTDWDDAGRWRAMHKHTWDRFLVDFNDAWVGAFTGVARANTVIEAIENAQTDISNEERLLAELRFLRAFYYFQLLDFFGNVPIVEDAVLNPDDPPRTAPRADVFAYIENELLFAAGALPPQSTWGAANFGRATSGAANALLARLYLNAEIMAGTPTASGIDKAPGRWGDAAAKADLVINSGEYDLTDDYLDNFRIDNHGSPEMIFVTPTIAKGGLGLNFVMRTLHYNQIPQTPWNGFIVLADVFNQFDPDDRRSDVFLVGQMYAEPNQGCIGKECFSDVNSGPLEDRQGNPLAFTPGLFTPEGTPVTSGEPININETSGVRVVKWEIDPSRVGGDNGNDYAWLRLAEMYLIKAEAAFRLGNNQEALTNLNVLRDRAFGNDPGKRLSAVTADVILQERQFELLWESVRRQDLVRFDRFTTRQWEFKTNTEPHHNVFPIPQVQVDANPNLTQNPGY